MIHYFTKIHDETEAKIVLQTSCNLLFFFLLICMITTFIIDIHTYNIFNLGNNIHDALWILPLLIYMIAFIMTMYIKATQSRLLTYLILSGASIALLINLVSSTQTTSFLGVLESLAIIIVCFRILQALSNKKLSK